MNIFNMTSKLIPALTAILLSMQLACIPSQPAVPPAAKQQNHAPVIEKITYARDVFSNSENRIDMSRQRCRRRQPDISVDV